MQKTDGGLEDKRYLILGGDDRFVELARIYRSRGYHVSTCGMDKVVIDGVFNYSNLKDAIEKSDIIITPVPFAKDYNKLNTKYSEQDINIEGLFENLGPDKLLFVGAINNHSKLQAEKYGISYYDYYTDESYQILNTIPTVEGTLQIIIQETKTTIFGSKILVLGYGRIGKVLSEYLKALGAEVYVEARKESDLTWIGTKGYKPVPLQELHLIIGDMDIIVNTIPALILDSSMLDLARKDGLLIDLASKPGGIDFSYANSKGLRTIHALGIPGIVACKSAALYIYNTILNYLTYLGKDE